MSRGKKKTPLTGINRQNTPLSDLPYNSYRQWWSDLQETFSSLDKNTLPPGMLPFLSRLKEIKCIADIDIRGIRPDYLLALTYCLSDTALAFDTNEALPTHNKLRGIHGMDLYLRLSGVYSELLKTPINKTTIKLINTQLALLQKEGVKTEKWFIHLQTLYDIREIILQTADTKHNQTLILPAAHEILSIIDRFDYLLKRSILMDCIKETQSSTTCSIKHRAHLTGEFEILLTKVARIFP